MTREWMEAQLGRMSVLRGFPESVDEFWHIFGRLPERVIAAGVSHAIRTRSFFPTPAELLKDCDFAKPPLPAEEPRVMSADCFEVTIRNPFGGADKTFVVDRLWEYYCDFCSDEGRQTYWCGSASDAGRKPWIDASKCDRRGEHGTHEWASRCACWDTNPKLVRQREREAEYSKGKARDAA